MDVLDEVFRCAQERFERRVAVASTEDVTVWRDDHFDKSGRGPVFTEQASENSLEVIADLQDPELAGAVLPNLIGFTDGGVVGHTGDHTGAVAESKKTTSSDFLARRAVIKA